MRKLVTFMLALTLMIGVANGATPVVFNGDSADPGADSSSDNNPDNALWDALGGGWDHINNSDEWDGTGPGVGKPGGVSALMDGATDYIRIQDTGDPRDHGFGEPSNRKIFLAHQIDFGLDGAQLEFRARLSTGAPLDDINPDGGGDTVAWPANGVGYPEPYSNGKNMIGIRDDSIDGRIGFGLAHVDQNPDVLQVTDGDGMQTIDVGDATVWHKFNVDIAAGGVNGYLVSVSVDDGVATVLDVGTDNGNTDYPGLNTIAMGYGSTGGFAAADIDYINAVPEPMTLTLLGLGGLGLIRRRRK